MIRKFQPLFFIASLMLIIIGPHAVLAVGTSGSVNVTTSITNTCNNDGVCSTNETASNCPNDCHVDEPPEDPTGGGGLAACNDTIDNDGDGFIDYPADPGCESLVDTSEVNLPPGVPNVLNLQAVYNPVTKHIDLSWRNPVFPTFAAVRIMRKTAPAISADPTDGILIYDGPAESAVDSDVVPGTTYFYTAFVRDTSVPPQYSSGSIAQASVPPTIPSGDPEPPNPDNPGGPTPPTPFDHFPGVYEGGSGFGAFQFLQVNEPTKYFAGGEDVGIIGKKNLTIFLPYELAPEALKIIGVTLFEPNNSGKSFSFILRINQSKTGYEATIGPLAAGIYPIKITLVNYQDQTVRILSGHLIITGAPVSVIGQAQPFVFGLGLLAGLFNLFLLANVTSLYDLYLLLLRAIGSLFGFFGWRKKRPSWGTVYDAITKRPLDPAYVSVLDRGNEVASAITDIDGRYGFLLPAGTYVVKAGKTHYQFPSAKLLGRTEDEFYDHLYFGTPFTTASGEVIIHNIPMDPIDFDWNEYVKTKKNFSQVRARQRLIIERILNTLFGIGLVVAILEMTFQPSTVNAIILGLYLGLLIIQLIIAAFDRKVVTITNGQTGEPYAFAIVKMFVPGIEQVMKKVVTDELGRCYILVPPGEYYLTVEEKKDDQSYALVYTSPTLQLKKGVLARDLRI